MDGYLTQPTLRLLRYVYIFEELGVTAPGEISMGMYMLP